MVWKSKKIKGFTLLEILVAVLILSIALSTVYVAYTGTFRLVQDVNQKNERLVAAQTFFNLIQDDLGHLVPYRGKFELRCFFKEIEGQKLPVLYFRSSHHLPLWEGNKKGGAAGVMYDILKGKEGKMGIWRRDRLISRPLSSYRELPGGFAVCDGIRSIMYSFYDASGKEHETWDSTAADRYYRKDQLPTAIMIKLELEETDEGTPPVFLSTKVYLPASQVGK